MPMLGDTDAAVFADSAQVVAFKIDDHVQFSCVLYAVAQFVAHLQIVVGLASTWSSALDGASDYGLASTAQEELW